MGIVIQPQQHTTDALDRATLMNALHLFIKSKQRVLTRSTLTKRTRDRVEMEIARAQDLHTRFGRA